MKKVSLTFLIVASVLMSFPLTGFAAAGEKPAQFAFFEPWQVFDKDTSIGGFRFNLIYGYNKDVTGLDFGMVNRASGTVSGIQLGAVNIVEGNFTGWQSSVANVNGGDVVGLQTGFYNSAGGKMAGVQVGFYNVAGSLNGLQLGVLNFNNSKKPMYFLPIVNFSF